MPEVQPVYESIMIESTLDQEYNIEDKIIEITSVNPVYESIIIESTLE